MQLRRKNKINQIKLLEKQISVYIIGNNLFLLLVSGRRWLLGGAGGRVLRKLK